MYPGHKIMAARKTTSVTGARRLPKRSSAQEIGGKSASPAVAAASIWHWLGLSQAKSVFIFFLLACLVVSGLSVVLTTHKSRLAFIELQRSKEQASALQVEWGQLLIEQSTFGLEGRIEQKATAQLNMQVPNVDEIVMVRND